MSTIYRCDRCGDTFDPIVLEYHDGKQGKLGSWRYDVVVDLHPYPSRKKDLCPNCKKELVEWLYNRKENNEANDN